MEFCKFSAISQEDGGVEVLIGTSPVTAVQSFDVSTDADGFHTVTLTFMTDSVNVDMHP